MALLDSSSVSVPYESLKRATRERKYVIDEVEGTLRGVQAEHAGSSSGGGEGGGEGAGSGSASADAVAARLDQYVQQLQGLKRKVGVAGAAAVMPLFAASATVPRAPGLPPPSG